MEEHAVSPEDRRGFLLDYWCAAGHWPLTRPNDSHSDRRRAQRSSVADLRVLYASQLQELHSTIEGSSKFVPTTPGRHIVSQVPDIYSLNPATYKVEYAVHLVLLDDAFLVAKRRRRRNGERGRLVAERCWALGEVTIVDVKDSSGTDGRLVLDHRLTRPQIGRTLSRCDMDERDMSIGRIEQSTRRDFSPISARPPRN